MTDDPKPPPRGGPVPRVPYSRALGEAICERIEAGDSLKEIAASEGFPPFSTLRGWLRIHPEFADRMAEALATAGKARSGPRSAYSHELAKEIVARLERGEKVRDLCADPRMPSPATLLAWQSQYPEFGRLYALVRDAQAEMLTDDVIEAAGNFTVENATAAAGEVRTLQWAVARISPRKPPARTEPAVAPTPTINLTILRFGNRKDPAE